VSELPNIPLCRSEFLQDFTICLGCRLERSKHIWRSLIAKVDTCEHDDASLERFTVWLHTIYRTRVSLTVWEDKTIWISVAFVPVHGEKFQVGFYPSFELLGVERVVEALIETVSVSTRLCYDESPVSLMRQIWKYDGEVKTAGVL
jgi:hypothetical protein